MNSNHLNEARDEGFSLTELMIGITIVGIISSVAVPKYVNSLDKARAEETKQKVASIPPIISAYIDASGEAPTTWDELSSVAVVMTSDGPATGDLNTPITLPNSIYDLSIAGPNDSVYTMTATRVIDRDKEEEEDAKKYTYAIKSCFNISNGASDVRSGNLSEIENTLNCG